MLVGITFYGTVTSNGYILGKLFRVQGIHDFLYHAVQKSTLKVSDDRKDIYRII